MALQRCTFLLYTFKNIFINFSLLPCSACCLKADSGLCMLEGSGLEACDKVHVSNTLPNYTTVMNPESPRLGRQCCGAHTLL